MRSDKTVLRDIFIALKPNGKKKKRLRFHFQKLEKEEQNKPKVNDGKEVRKRRTEVIKEQINKFNKAKIGYLKRSTEITPSCTNYFPLPPPEKREDKLPTLEIKERVSLQMWKFNKSLS